MQTKNVVNATLVSLMIVWAGCLDAQERRTGASVVLAAASGPPSIYVKPLGVPLAPPIYFVNFLLLYWSSPESAAGMPASRAALPQEVYKCLLEHPDGCPYSEMAQFFAQPPFPNEGNTFWPSSCQTTPRWRALAPPEYRLPGQVNEELGRKTADQIAQLLGITADMILTDDEYTCLNTTGIDPAQELINACPKELTNSIGNETGEVPLSSYGLAVDELGNVRSLCAPHAPCLEFNKLFAGPLEHIAEVCGFADKLKRLTTATPLLEFIEEGSDCQQTWMPSCIAEAPCSGNGGGSNGSCAPPIATPQ